jgi:LysM repeat protein
VSLAPEFAPEVVIPARARRAHRGGSASRSARIVARSGVHGLPGADVHSAGARATLAEWQVPAAVPSPTAPTVKPASTPWTEPRRVAVARPSGAPQLTEPIPAGLLIIDTGASSESAPKARLSTRLAVEAPKHLRLTRRGAVAIAGLMLLICVGLLGIAKMSAPSSAGPAPAAPAIVTVQAGDTLWSIAGDIAPQRDPRNVVADLRRINELSSVALTPGQILRTR